MSNDAPAIRNDDEFCAALAEVDRLWNSAEGTPEGDRLEALSDAVEAYEKEHWPAPPPSIDDIIQFRLEQSLVVATMTGAERDRLEKWSKSVLDQAVEQIAQCINGKTCSIRLDAIRPDVVEKARAALDGLDVDVRDDGKRVYVETTTRDIDHDFAISERLFNLEKEIGAFEYSRVPMRGDRKGVDITCDECGGALADEAREDFEFASGVVLRDVDIQKCEECGAKRTSIRCVAQATDAVAAIRKDGSTRPVALRLNPLDGRVEDSDLT